jgi:Tfp pilus assembly protein PilZ
MSAGASNERRSSGMLRVPFVRLCALSFEDGRERAAFIVNINVLGAYLAWEETASVGEGLSLRFGTPGNALGIEIRTAVAWVNPKQQHPVHSLPAGFGVKFLDLADDVRRRIERIVEDYVARHPQGAR